MIKISEEARALIYLLAALLGVLLLRYAGVLLGSESIYLGDATLYFEPLCRYIGQSLAHGHVPLWNPYSFCGMSQAAIPSPGLFYPFSLLFALVPFSQAVCIQLICHQLVCAAGMFILIRATGKGILPALIGGTIVALSGYMFSLTGNYTLILTAAWIPLVCACMLSITPKWDRQNAWRLVSSFVATGMMVLAGRPEIFAPFVLLLFVWLGLAAFMQKRWHAFAYQCCGLGGGLLLAAPMLLPTLEWSLISPRAAGLSSSDVLTWSANWYDFLGMIASQPLGDLSTASAHFLPMVASHANAVPYVPSCYVGVIPPVLAGVALLTFSGRQRSLAALSMLILIIICLGKNSIFAPLLMMPGLNVLRYPVKLMCLPIFATAFFAAAGSALLFDRTESDWGRKVPSVVTILLVLAGVLTCLFSDALVESGFVNGHHNFAFGMELIGFQTVCAGVVTALFWGTWLQFRRNQVSSRSFGMLILAFIAVPLISSALVSPRHFGDGNFFKEKSRVAEVIHPATANGVGTGGSAPRSLATYMVLRAVPSTYSNDSHADPVETFHQYNRDLLVPNTQMDAQIPSPAGYETSETAAYRQLFLAGTEIYDTRSILTNSPAAEPDKGSELAFWRFCQMTSTSHVLSLDMEVAPQGVRKARSLDARFFTLATFDAVRNLRIFKTRDPLERAYFAKTCKRTDNTFDVIDALNNPGSNFPRDLTFIAGLESAEEHFSGDSDSVDIRDEGSDKIVCETNSATRRILVVTDQMYPGWNAYLDGAKIPIMTANNVQRSVWMPAGKHILTMRYEPLSLYVGIAICLITCFGAGVAIKLARRAG